MTVELAVIPAAGRGTRMRPATRAVPKSFLPLVDRPAIQWVIEEGIRAGVREFILIVDPGLDDLVIGHFVGLEGYEDLVITPVVQEQPLGLGAAVAEAEDAVDGRSFFCLLADNLVVPGHDVLPGLAAASDGRSTMCLRRLDEEGLSRYGVVVPGAWLEDDVVEVVGAVEKPGPELAPSDLGFVGRYLFTSQVFGRLRGLDPGYGGEIQLTDAIGSLGADGSCLGYVSDHDLLDVGHPAGYLEAGTVLGLHHPVIGAGYRDAIKRALDEAP